MRISEDTTGRYTCSASVPGFTSVTATAELFQKGPPYVINTKSEQFGRVGDSVELKCETSSIPPPNLIMWGITSKDGKYHPIDFNNPHYKVIYIFGIPYLI